MIENAIAQDLIPAVIDAPVVLNTEFARASLRKRFAAPEWALVEEVAPSTGGGTRYADAVAVNLWRSRGHAIHGIEIKVHRSDWLRELKQPQKAESVYAYCNHWWIVAPAGVVKDGELPPTWGLLQLRPSGPVQMVAAPRLTPTPIDIGFFASLMRRGQESIDAVAERKMRYATIEARAEIERRVADEVKSRSRKLAELQEHMAEIARATGIDFDRYNGPSINTIKLAQRIETLSGWSRRGVFDELEQLATTLENHGKTLREALAEQSLCAQVIETPGDDNAKSAAAA